MKTTLIHYSISIAKINLQRFQNNIAHNTQQIIEDIRTSEVYKMYLIYYICVISVILLLAFVQLNNTGNIVKIVLGLLVLVGNFFLIKKYNF